MRCSPVIAQQLQYEVNPTTNHLFLTFTRQLVSGKGQPQCWNATTLRDGTSQQDITADTQLIRPINFFEPTDLTIQPCQGQLDLAIEVVDSISSPLGWKHIPGEDVHVEIHGYWSLPTSMTNDISMMASSSGGWDVALVVQLCPVGTGSLCPPLVPAQLILETRRRKQRQRQLTSTPSDRLMDFEFYPMTDDRIEFNKELFTLLPSSSGIFSIVGSLMLFPKGQTLDDIVIDDETTGLFNNTAIYGVSIIPFSSSSGQEEFVFVHPLYWEDKNLPNVGPAVVEEWASFLVLGCCIMGGLTILVLLLFSIYYRKAQVFELTQGKFLIAMLFSGLVSTCSLFLLEPKNDLYCHLHQPLINLPMSLMFAILIGRMWRIRAIISPLLLLTLEKKEDWTSKVVNVVEKLTRFVRCGNRNAVSGKQIRMTITDRQLLIVIVLMCLPQTIVQVLIATTTQQGFDIDYGIKFFPNGYAKCKVHYFDNFLSLLAFSIVIGQCLMLLVLAGYSRDLPSLFNETQSIWFIAAVAFAMALLGMLVMALTYSQESAPTTQFLVLSLLGGVTIVHTCIRITWGKISFARNGTKIAVTKLIATHNRSRQSQISVCVRPLIDEWSSNAQNASQREFVSSPSDLNAKHTNDKNTTLLTEPTTSGHERQTITPVVGDCPLSTLHEEDEGAHAKLNATEVPPHSRDNMRTSSSAAEDDDDGSSTDSSVVMAGEPTTDPIGSAVDMRPTLSLKQMHLPSASTISHRASIDNALRTSCLSVRTVEDATWSSAISANQSRSRSIFQTRASRASALTLDIEASAPPALAFARSDSVVPNQTSKQDTRPTLTMRDRVRSQFRFTHSKISRQRSSLSSNAVGMIDGSPVSPLRHKRQAALIPLTIEYNPKNKSDSIVVATDIPPPRRLLLRMIDVQRRLTKANTAILSGLGLEASDWEGIRDACISLGEVFVLEVRFEWEPELDHSYSNGLPPDMHPLPVRDDANETTRKPSQIVFDDDLKSRSLSARSSETQIYGTPRSPQVLLAKSDGLKDPLPHLDLDFVDVDT